MKKVLLFVSLMFSTQLFSQDVSLLIKEAGNLEKTQKEEQAFDKYKQVIATDPVNIQSLIRSSELCSLIGQRQTDKMVKKDYYYKATEYADKAIAIDSNNADANYVKAVAASRLTEVETENKKLVAEVKEIRIYADKALAINPNHGRANYVHGKWNYDLTTLSWAKKAAFKVLYGSMGDASLENAYKYMEKCRSLEPYYVRNFLDLAKAYKADYKPAKAIEVLNQLVKLPTRQTDDVALKAEGKQLLSEMQ